MRYRIVEVGNGAYDIEAYVNEASNMRYWNTGDYWQIIQTNLSLESAENYLKRLIPKERKVIKEINTESRGQHD